MGRILALDWGTERIGAAISDETKTISQPLPAVLAEEKEKIAELVFDKNVELILLGLPIELKGNEGKSAKAVKGFGGWLNEATGIEVKYLDERFSSKGALRQMKDYGYGASESRDGVDSFVAQILLESFLEALRT